MPLFIAKTRLPSKEWLTGAVRCRGSAVPSESFSLHWVRFQCKLQRRLRPIFCDLQDHTLLVSHVLPHALLHVYSKSREACPVSRNNIHRHVNLSRGQDWPEPYLYTKSLCVHGAISSCIGVHCVYGVFSLYTVSHCVHGVLSC